MSSQRISPHRLLNIMAANSQETSMTKLKILRKFAEYEEGEVITVESDVRSKFLKVLGLAEDIK